MSKTAYDDFPMTHEEVNFPKIPTLGGVLMSEWTIEPKEEKVMTYSHISFNMAMALVKEQHPTLPEEQAKEVALGLMRNWNRENT
jgi:hypothetical protein